MARIRSIKPELWISPQVMNLSHGARLLFIGLITQADDKGRGTADLRKLKAAIFGGDDDVTTARIVDFLKEIEVQNLCITYDGNGHGRVYALPTFTDHQYIQRPKESTYPAPPNQSLEHEYRTRTGSVSAEADTGIGGSDRIGSEGSDRKDLGAVDKQAASRRELASARGRLARGEGSQPRGESPEAQARRRQADELVERLAAKGAGS